VRVLGFPIVTPQTAANRFVSDLGAISRAAREAPAQLDRMLEIGVEVVAIGREMLEIAERLDQRAAAFMALGEKLESQAGDLIEVGRGMRQTGAGIDDRGSELVEAAARVVHTGGELIAVLPALERALEMATPLEGAIDRFGRFVDRLPGGAQRRRIEPRPPREQEEEILDEAAERLNEEFED
jgi:hypothetical protein